MGSRSEIPKKEHKHELMLAWRFALLAYLDAAIEADALNSELSRDELALVLETEAQRNWNIFVGRRVSKKYRNRAYWSLHSKTADCAIPPHQT